MDDGAVASVVSFRRSHRMRVTVLVWVLRLLFACVLILLCSLADSGMPAFAFALAWGPNGFFLVVFMKGKLHLPRALEVVHPIEPVLYRWLGVGLMKRIVANRMWPLFVGMEPPSKAGSRHELLYRVELSTKGGEICHGATFILVLLVALFYHAIGQHAFAFWTHGFNILFNGYPVMLQRSNRWRIQEIQRRVSVAA